MHLSETLWGYTPSPPFDRHFMCTHKKSHIIPPGGGYTLTIYRYRNIYSPGIFTRKSSSQEWTVASKTHADYTSSVLYSCSSHVIPKHFLSTQKKMHPKCHGSPTLIHSMEETLDGNKQKLHDQQKYTSIRSLMLKHTHQALPSSHLSCSSFS